MSNEDEQQIEMNTHEQATRNRAYKTHTTYSLDKEHLVSAGSAVISIRQIKIEPTDEFASDSEGEEHFNDNIEDIESNSISGQFKQSREHFECVICYESFNSQLNFYHHLRSHYDTSDSSFQTGSESQKIKNPTKNSSFRFLTPHVTIERWKTVPIKTEDFGTDTNEMPMTFTNSGRVSIRPLNSDMVPTDNIDLDDFLNGYSMSGDDKSAYPRVLQPKKLKRSGITVRRIQMEENGPIKYECQVCRKLISCGTSMKAHMETHQAAQGLEQRENITYPLQLKPMIGRKSGKAVKRIQLEENGPIKYECDLCHNLFGSITSLQVHELIHKGIKPLECKHCGKRFRQYSDLRGHIMSIHTEKKAYQCEFCGKEFAVKFSLTIHRKIHTGVRDYVCDVCNKGFRAAMYLNDHKRSHTGEKPFLCDICGTSFRTATLLRRHRVNVHFKGDRVAEKLSRKKPNEDEHVIVPVEPTTIQITGPMEVVDENQITIQKLSDDTELPIQHRFIFVNENEVILQ